ncbi:putative host range and adsorption protein [Aeromonas phage AHPMCC7]|nr:putative host range and adsorption protein [Aeromonas phage AHPMCC7]
MIGTVAAERMFRAYHPEAHSTLSESIFVNQARRSVLGTNRQEAYLFDISSDRQEPILALIMAAEPDLHRGNVAVPLVCYIHPDYRGVPSVVRALASYQLHVGRALSCRWLMRMKHINDNARLITYKEL